MDSGPQQSVESPKGRESNVRNSSAWKKPAAIVLVSVVLSLTYLTFPRQPYLLDDSLSEKAVLNYAHEKGLQFGKDIVFSYGPLGFLTSRYFFPHAAGVRFLTDLFLCAI